MVVVVVVAVAVSKYSSSWALSPFFKSTMSLLCFSFCYLTLLIEITGGQTGHWTIGRFSCNFAKCSPHTHTPINSPFSRTTWVSRYQKGKTNLDFTEARDSECQWHQLGHMQVCTSLQTDNHASTPPLSFFYRSDALPAAQPTASKHWRDICSPS